MAHKECSDEVKRVVEGEDHRIVKLDHRDGNASHHRRGGRHHHAADKVVRVWCMPATMNKS